MKILIDTQILLWWDRNAPELAPTAKSLCEDPNNTLFLSIASVWEMQIKSQLGKLELRLPLRELIQNQMQTNGMELLPITLDHVLTLQGLPPRHKDPFDRLLIAQAKSEGWPLLSADAVFENYAVELLK